MIERAEAYIWSDRARAGAAAVRGAVQGRRHARRAGGVGALPDARRRLRVRAGARRARGRRRSRRTSGRRWSRSRTRA